VADFIGMDDFEFLSKLLHHPNVVESQVLVEIAASKLLLAIFAQEAIFRVVLAPLLQVHFIFFVQVLQVLTQESCSHHHRRLNIIDQEEEDVVDDSIVEGVLVVWIEKLPDVENEFLLLDHKGPHCVLVGVVECPGRLFPLTGLRLHEREVVEVEKTLLELLQIQPTLVSHVCCPDRHLHILLKLLEVDLLASF